MMPLDKRHPKMLARGGQREADPKRQYLRVAQVVSKPCEPYLPF